MNRQQVIKALDLEPLTIEGGFFNEIYRSSDTVTLSGRDRCLGTSIYYMLDGASISDWHRVASDEIWYYHAGSAAVQLLLYPDGSWSEVVIGSDLIAGQRPQSIILAGTWQAALLLDRSEGSWGLFGASVFPGFEYDDFELGNGMELSKMYLDASQRIEELGLC